MFPTKESLDGARRILQLTSVKSAILARRSELEKLLYQDEIRPYLTLELSDGQKIVFALVAQGRILRWSLVHPERPDPTPVMGSSQEIAAQIVQLFDHYQGEASPA